MPPIPLHKEIIDPEKLPSIVLALYRAKLPDVANDASRGAAPVTIVSQIEREWDGGNGTINEATMNRLQSMVMKAAIAPKAKKKSVSKPRKAKKSAKNNPSAKSYYWHKGPISDSFSSSSTESVRDTIKGILTEPALGRGRLHLGSQDIDVLWQIKRIKGGFQVDTFTTEGEGYLGELMLSQVFPNAASVAKTIASI